MVLFPKVYKMKKMIKFFLLGIIAFIIIMGLAQSAIKNAFTIEEYIIAVRYNGNAERHENARKNGYIKYCKNYVVYEFKGNPINTDTGYTNYTRIDDRSYSSNCAMFSRRSYIFTLRPLIPFSYRLYSTPYTGCPPKDLDCSNLSRL